MKYKTEETIRLINKLYIIMVNKVHFTISPVSVLFVLLFLLPIRIKLADKQVLFHLAFLFQAFLIDQKFHFGCQFSTK